MKTCNNPELPCSSCHTVGTKKKKKNFIKKTLSVQKMFNELTKNIKVWYNHILKNSKAKDANALRNYQHNE